MQLSTPLIIMQGNTTRSQPVRAAPGAPAGAPPRPSRGESLPAPRDTRGYFEPRLFVSDSITWSTVKLAAFCRGGYSLNVWRNWPT